MPKKDLPLLIVVAVFAALFSLIVANVVFHSPPRNTKIPQVDQVNASFPDVKGDSAYSSFLNLGALDPTQPIQIGNSQNNVPFR